MRVTIFCQTIISIISIQCFIFPGWTKIGLLRFNLGEYRYIYQRTAKPVLETYILYNPKTTFLHESSCPNIENCSFGIIQASVESHLISTCNRIKSLVQNILATKIELSWTRVNTTLNCQIFLESLLFRRLLSVSKKKSGFCDRSSGSRISYFLPEWIISKLFLVLFWEDLELDCCWFSSPPYVFVLLTGPP